MCPLSLLSAAAAQPLEQPEPPEKRPRIDASSSARDASATAASATTTASATTVANPAVATAAAAAAAVDGSVTKWSSVASICLAASDSTAALHLAMRQPAYSARHNSPPLLSLDGSKRLGPGSWRLGPAASTSA